MPRIPPPIENPDLLAAVIAAPADDVPRLVYADWLQENGQGERAEFIRVQCRLAEVFADDPDYIPLKDRETELAAWLDTFAPIGLPTLPAGFTTSGSHPFEYDDPEYVGRGFPKLLFALGNYADAMPSYDPPMAWFDDLFRATTLRVLRVIVDRPDFAVRLLSHPATATLSGLALQSPLGPDVLQALAASPAAANLTELRISTYLTDEQCVALAATKFPRLRAFQTESPPDGPGGMAALRRADWFANLTALAITEPSAHDLHALATGPPLPKLRKLTLLEGLDPAAGLAALARSKAVPNLVELDADDTPLTATAVAAIADAKWKLVILRLSKCELTAAAAGHVLSAKWLGSLKVLDLSLNPLSFGAVSLAACEKFRHLRHLDLGGTEGGWGILSAVAGNKALRRLTRLDLWADFDDARGVAVKAVAGFLADLNMPDLRHLALNRWPVGAAGAKVIATNPAFANLASLELDHCKVTNTGAAALAGSPQLQNLVRLALVGNGLDAAAETFANRAVFPRLADLNVRGNKASAAAQRKLMRRPGVVV